MPTLKANKAKVIQLIAKIDQIMSEQLSLVIADEKFQQLEASWRNLYALVNLPINFSFIKLKILNISWEEISKDLNLSSKVKDSKLHNIIVNKEYNTLGGEPFGVITVNHNISKEIDFESSYDDVYTLELLAELGERSLTPFIIDIQDDFFGLSSEEYISDYQKIDRALKGNDFCGWNRLRASTSSHFIATVYNKIAFRKRYQNQKVGFIFNEVSEDEYFWANTGMTLMKNIMVEFSRVKWFGFLKNRTLKNNFGSAISVGNGGLYETPTFKAQRTLETAKVLSERGIIPIVYNTLSKRYYFYSNNSVQLPDGNNSQIIQTTLMVSRIAHYLKIKLRKLIGTMKEANECEELLNNWLQKYCSNSTVSDENVLAAHPLKLGSVKVTKEQGSNNSFHCEMLLVPQYQYDRLNTQITLSTQLDG